MKFTKQSAICLFLAGAIIFGSVAIADVLIGSGYGGAKEALKRTTKYLENKADSCTFSTGFEAIYDGELMEKGEEIAKYDFKNEKWESWGKSYTKKGGENERYFYEDREKYINNFSDSDTWYVTNHNQKWRRGFEDPFSEEYAKDIEKIADAFVSSMKDFVQVKEDEGGKLYFGNLDSSQMPAFVSALSSVGTKYILLNDYHRNKNEEIKDAYIKSVSGKIYENADGILEGGIGEIVAIAIDNSGNEHEWVFSVSAELADMNTTQITAPDLTGKKVETQDEAKSESFGRMYERDIGSYHGDIVEKAKDSYIKKGSVDLTISEAEEEKISGHIKVTGTSRGDIDTDFTAYYGENYGDYVYTYQSGGETRYITFSVSAYINQFTSAIVVDSSIVELTEDGFRRYDDNNERKIVVPRIFE